MFLTRASSQPVLAEQRSLCEMSVLDDCQLVNDVFLRWCRKFQRLLTFECAQRTETNDSQLNSRMVSQVEANSAACSHLPLYKSKSA